MRTAAIALFLFTSSIIFAQPAIWQASLLRPDGKKIVFLFEWKKENGKDNWYIINATERLKVSNITRKGDSLFVEMPLFESQFRLAYTPNRLEGTWIKGGSKKSLVLPFVAVPGMHRFPASKAVPPNISGRWSLVFSPDTQPDSSVAELRQTGNKVTGTILNATGDYRYLDGIVTGDSIFLSTFDGSHAMLFTARVDNKNSMSGGGYFSGGNNEKKWEAVRNTNARVNADESAMYLREGEERLDFTFKDIEGKPVSINDEQFRNKVVVIQLMGSWCPNCMDETAFLTEYYNHNKDRGVSIIALAYEYSTDWDRSVKSLRKFQKRYNIQYPILITGVSTSDSLRTEKTLPQVTPIKFFPSSIILDKKGRVRKLDTSFNGPATGKHYEEYKKEFEQTINALLREE